MRRRIAGLTTALALGLAATIAGATADGPDFYAVTGVAANDVLNMRAAPSADAAKVGEIPHDADGLTNLGCVGGMTYAEFEKATEAEREAARKTRWCRLLYETQVGWVAGWFLREGGESTRPGVRMLADHAGSEWRLAAFPDGEPATEVTVRFAADNTVMGNTGCNRFTATYVQRGLAILIGDAATTRMMCPDNVMATEARTLDVLARAREIAGGVYTMGLFAADGTLLATFRRTDWD